MICIKRVIHRHRRKLISKRVIILAEKNLSRTAMPDTFKRKILA